MYIFLRTKSPENKKSKRLTPSRCLCCFFHRGWLNMIESGLLVQDSFSITFYCEKVLNELIICLSIFIAFFWSARQKHSISECWMTISKYQKDKALCFIRWIDWMYGVNSNFMATWIIYLSNPPCSTSALLDLFASIRGSVTELFKNWENRMGILIT